MRDAGDRRRARVLHLGVQLLLGLPAVPRGHRPRAGGGRRRTPRGAASCGRSTTTRASSRRTPTACATRSRRSRRSGARAAQLVFTAHSIPVAMAERCRYAEQLAETSRLVAEAVGADDALGRLPEPQRLAAGAVARAGRLRRDPARARARRARPTSVDLAGRLRLRPHRGALRPRPRGRRGRRRGRASPSSRAGTAGTHPAFVSMIRELIQERLDPRSRSAPSAGSARARMSARRTAASPAPAGPAPGTNSAAQTPAPPELPLNRSRTAARERCAMALVPAA